MRSLFTKIYRPRHVTKVSHHRAFKAHRQAKKLSRPTDCRMTSVFKSSIHPYQVDRLICLHRHLMTTLLFQLGQEDFKILAQNFAVEGRLVYFSIKPSIDVCVQQVFPPPLNRKTEPTMIVMSKMTWNYSQNYANVRNDYTLLPIRLQCR